MMASCARYNHQDVIKDNKQRIEKGIADWRITHDTNCLARLMPIVDSCIEFQDYCNRHDTLYLESYFYKELKINMLNSLQRYDEALVLIDQLPNGFGLSASFGKNYLSKTTLIRKNNYLKCYATRDSIINELIKEMNFQFRASYENITNTDTVYYGRNLLIVDTTDYSALMDYYLICIIRGDDKNKMINKVKQTFSNDEMYRESLIDWINNTTAHDFYDM
jgi:hypothetical protein